MTTCSHIPPQSFVMYCSWNEWWWGRSLREANGDWCYNDSRFLPRLLPSLLGSCAANWILLKILYICSDLSEDWDIISGLNSLHSSQMYEKTLQGFVSFVWPQAQNSLSFLFCNHLVMCFLPFATSCESGGRKSELFYRNHCKTFIFDGYIWVDFRGRRKSSGKMKEHFHNLIWNFSFPAAFL